MVLSPTDSSPSNPSSTIHQFLISNPISNQNQHFDGVDLMRSLGGYPQPLPLLPSIQFLEERMSRSMDLVHDDIAHHHHHRRGGGGGGGERVLSLSLGGSGDLLVPPSQTPDHHHLQPYYNNLMISPQETTSTTASATANGDYYSFATNASGGGFAVAVSIASSRFLKPAQSLLEELVSVDGKEIESINEAYAKKLSKRWPEFKAHEDQFCSNGLLLSMEMMDKQQLHQTKTAKLIALLEQVETRYERYYQQLEEVVSSFEVVAGLGVGRSYTALALHAMSAHFCSLRDAILAQIYATRNKSLSRFDTDQTSQNLRQLGLMIAPPRHTWRPIRGLPETSVMILRSWLFQHFLHPYPNDNEKLMLASQTGLSKNQVSNWFINARVRLWKPMIEEMYKEEFADEFSEEYSSAGSPGSKGINDHVED